MALTHIVGAGMSGLSCAVQLVLAGRDVVVYEAAGHAGGRCRSFHDETLGREIDNGNHLLLSGNRAAMAFLTTVGSRDSLLSPARAAFPFIDFSTDQRWTVRPGPGRFPSWIFDDDRRVADSRPTEYLRALRLAVAGDRTVAECFDTSRPIYRRFWEPLAVAVLNTAAEEAAASLLWPVVLETFGRGEAASRPCIARHGLSRTFVDPALSFLERHGAAVRFGERLRAIELGDAGATRLAFARHEVDLGHDDQLVIAVPPAVANDLLPGLRAPRDSRPIVNAHFRLPDPPEDASPDEEGLSFLGMVGGDADWLFLRDDIASVTVSAAVELAELPAEQVAVRLWLDVSRALALPVDPLPPVRIVKEKRATFAQTPAAVALRPDTRTRWPNILLAGDWTDTGLPATIEGSMRSGEKAAAAVVSAR